MSSSDSLDQLKSLVSQLQKKIERLESQASSTAQDATQKVGQAVQGAKETVKEVVGDVKEGLTPGQHLRLVLMGPPGAGKLNHSTLYTLRVMRLLVGGVERRTRRIRKTT